ncbi:hypothetical protein [Novosphingobium sp. TH158]|uniref:hypothetical protein n=1 Tax=Novosphingobium sp. TH158 TaxID=2067455 RepID=UPI001304473A|nr:hypothetical protein [Novosphingobium sp. TH158]
MSDRDPRQPNESFDPAAEAGEEKGKIKRPQRTDATMAEKDLARGSEPETRAASRRRQ